MTEPTGCHVTVETMEGDAFKRYLQGILNRRHQNAYPWMEVPDSKRSDLRVTDPAGRPLGGAQLWACWGWLDLSLVARAPAGRGRGLGRRLMARIETLARQENCPRIRVETFEEELGFFQALGHRVVGKLEDYPQNGCFYWLRKDLPPAGLPGGLP